MNKSQKSPHDSLEVKCGSCEHDVDRVSEKTLVEFAPQAMITLAVSDNGFDVRPLPEEFVFLTDAMTEMDKLRGCAWSCYAECFHATELLVAGVLRKLRHNLLVRHIAQVFEHEQAHHQTDGFGRTSVVSTKERGKGFLKARPIDNVGQFEQGVLWIQHGLQVPEKSDA